MCSRLRSGLLFALLARLLGAEPLEGATYDELRAAAVRQCEAIDSARYQTGLALNSPGYRSYYERSRCFQDAAIQFRDESLCGHVWRRYSLFSSSWGYSASRCRELVAQAMTGDRAALEAVRRRHADGGMRMVDFTFEQNGNNRDFDIIPSFAGTYSGGYRLTFEIVHANTPRPPTVIHSAGYYVDATSNMRLFVTQAEIRQRFPDFEPGRTYSVRSTISLDPGMGGASGYWSDAFLESVFPARERARTLLKAVRF